MSLESIKIQLEIVLKRHHIAAMLFGFSFVIFIAFLLSLVITHQRLNSLSQTNLMPYGPLPSLTIDAYNYSNVKKPFGSLLPLKRSTELSKTAMKEVIAQALPEAQRESLMNYLDEILSMTEEYQIDPFWAISVMLVESNFDSSAVSYKRARGLMQIMPETAQYLLQMRRIYYSLDEVLSELLIPKSNIELGVFYLKRLLQKFRMNYPLATVAYNVGPGRIRVLLSEDTSRNFLNSNYYLKVKERYELLTLPFIERFSKGPVVKLTSNFPSDKRILKL